MTGSYVPRLWLGHPQEEKQQQYQRQQVSGVTLYRALSVQAKAGQTIRVVRKGFLFWAYLEVEGVRPLSSRAE